MTRTKQNLIALPNLGPGRAVLFVRRRSRGFSPVAGAVVVGLLMLAAAALAGWRLFDGGRLASSGGTASAPVVAGDEDAVPEQPLGPPRAIDGVRGPEGEPAEAPYFAVVIDNLSEARPAHGLNAASVVYEAPVESGITRFLAIVRSGASAEKIGPVRSARPYFIDWAAEYDAVLVHCGGSPESLGILKAGAGVTDLNEFWNGARFWRAEDRLAPHNVYTSSELLEKFAVARELEPDPLAAWRFKSDAALDDRPDDVADLIVSGRTFAYTVRWAYDREQNAYRRYQGGAPQEDAARGEPVMAKNVVIQLTAVSVIDEIGRRKIATSGEGEALMALDGNTYRGTWRRAGSGGRTRFYDASGTEVRLNAGTTWIEVVPKETEISY